MRHYYKESIASPLATPDDLFIKDIRIFGVAVKKSGKVADFSSKLEGKWVWRIEIRRVLFEWELSWDEFIGTLNRVAHGSAEADSVIWIGASSGMYVPKSFCVAAYVGNSSSDDFWNLVWAKLAPLKVEAFVWRAALQRIPSLVDLARMGVVNLESVTCVLYSRDPETINHLFCHCSIVWRLWQKWALRWNIHFVCPGLVALFIGHHKAVIGPVKGGSFGESPNYGGDSPWSSTCRGAAGLLETSTRAASWK
ncbi:hypothetical protein F3Y22_tig00008146pilonHSYRG00076 [Hibiscus syriacus]|uniref:Reverse transcriptase zinc-binding domain-containing protein n=1 Tax=Hibiscus syriacus TaxID=106335 RepID=A0A6A3CAI8_HIBSY|nr:hypothetical protein F3Y22_tig00008146pilonHSYRG00076 [Hibiscus syriacus]